MDQPVIQGTFLLSHLWARVLFDSGASYSFIAASVVIELGLEVEALEEPLYVSYPLGIRVRIGMICRGCELEISGTLLTVDLRIMDMSEFDVILGMDWLTAYRVIIDCERRRVTAICSFLGLAGYYKIFIEDFSRLAAPMTRLTRKEVKFDWDDRC